MPWYLPALPPPLPLITSAILYGKPQSYLKTTLHSLTCQVTSSLKTSMLQTYTHSAIPHFGTRAYIQPYNSYNHTIHTTIQFIQPYNSYNHTIHTTIQFIQPYNSYNHTIHTTIQFIQPYNSYNHTIHTTIQFIQPYNSYNHTIQITIEPVK